MTPASSSTAWLFQPRTLGPRTSALRWMSAVSRSASRASGAGAESSCSSHTQRTTSSPPGSRVPEPVASAAATAAPNPVSRPRVTTRSTRPAASALASSSAVPSVLPVSTATMRSGRRPERCSAVRTAGSQRTPSWATRTPVTRCSRRGTSRSSSSTSSSSSSTSSRSPATSGTRGSSIDVTSSSPAGRSAATARTWSPSSARWARTSDPAVTADGSAGASVGMARKPYATILSAQIRRVRRPAHGRTHRRRAEVRPTQEGRRGIGRAQRRRCRRAAAREQSG